MKYVKMLGLAAVAAAVVLALVAAGPASAAVLCKTKTNPCTSKWAKGTKIEFSLKAGTSALWRETSGTTIKTCTNAKLAGEITTEGNASEPVKISVPASGFEWSSCTVATNTIEGGQLEISTITGTENGTVKMKGLKFTTNSILGSCSYGSATAVDLGTLTASSIGDSVLDVNALLTETSGICCPDVVWIEEFTITKPQETPLFVEPS